MANFSTKAARVDAVRRTRMQNEHRRRLNALHVRLTATHLRDVRDIPQADWDAAVKADKEAQNAP